MISRYGIFCKVIELGSFTKVAEQMGYSQSAISQTIKTLEQEIGTRLINRKKDGIALTKDGEQFLPYIQSIYHSEESLWEKQREMKGMNNTTIRIGTFTSVSRNILPPLMMQFKELYPGVNFVLNQGEYTSIGKWIQSGNVDFGFVNTDAVSDIKARVLFQDEMMAVLPMSHPLTKKTSVTLKELSKETFIQLDEGEYSVLLNACQTIGIVPDIEYKVHDDYSILAMVRQGLGVSAIYRLVLQGFENGLEVRQIDERPKRSVAIAWQNWDTMPFASRRFAEFIIDTYQV